MTAILRGDERVALVEVVRSESGGAGRRRAEHFGKSRSPLYSTVSTNADAALPTARFT